MIRSSRSRPLKTDFRQLPRWLIPFLVGAIFRGVLPWFAHGFRYMDEHWQVFEPANSLLGNPWSITAEWVQGARSWIYPFFVSLGLRLGAVVGLENPLHLASFVRSLHGVFCALSIPLSYFLLQTLCEKPNDRRTQLWAQIAAWFVALWPYALYCSTHLHGEMTGAIFVLSALHVAYSPRLKQNRMYLSGLLFGIAFLCKVDVAVAGLAFGIWQILHRRKQQCLQLALGVLPCILVLGLVDKLTWGTWFQSVTTHAKVNLVDGVGNQWGTSPWYMHFVYFFDSCGPLAICGALFALLNLNKLNQLTETLRGTWFINLFFVAVYATVPHKEKRFLAPVLYTGIVAGIASLPALMQTQSISKWLMRYKSKFILGTVSVIAVHAVANFVTYIVRQPWSNRIHAILTASEIPNISLFLTPQWPAYFYFPKNIKSKVSTPDEESLTRALRGVRHFGLATDWNDLGTFKHLGYLCSPWPQARPPGVDIPWAYSCRRQ